MLKSAFVLPNRGCGITRRLLLQCQSDSRSFPSSIPFVLLSTLAVSISYADRSNLSTAVIPMAAEFNWDSFFTGLVLSAFWIGYGLTQIAGGKLSDKVGGEKVLMGSLLAWSVCTALTPTAAFSGDIQLLATRVFLGAGEGFALPAIHSMTSKYVDPTDRSVSTSVITAGCFVGALLANLIAPTVIDRYGWEVCFWSFAALPSGIWLPMWLRFMAVARVGKTVGTDGEDGGVSTVVQSALHSDEDYGTAESDPTRTSSVDGGRDELCEDFSMVPNDATTDSIAGSDGSFFDAVASIPQLLSCGPVWAIIITQYCNSWGMYGLLSWMPSYFADKYSVPVAALGSYTVLPYVLQLVLAVAAGYAADFLRGPRMGWRTLYVRHIMQVSGMLLPAVFLALCALLPNLTLDDASALIAIGSALTALTVAGVSCSHFDLSPRNAGAIYGIGNTAACVAGAIAVPVCGWIYDSTHSWEVVFLVFALHYVVGAAAWLLLASDKRLQFQGLR